MEAEDVINLHLSRGKIFVWNPRDVRLLRETHHIVGSLTGALPRAPRQNIQLGLPLELMPEEAFALISYGVGVLVKLPLPNATEEDISTFQEARRHSFEVQKELYTEQIRAKKEALKGLEHQQMSKRKRKQKEKKEKKKKKKKDEKRDQDSLEISVVVSRNENEGRSVEECAADSKDVEKTSVSSPGIVVKDNAFLETVTVTSSGSVESYTDQILLGSVYTSSDSKQESSYAQVLGDQVIHSSSLEENPSSSQQCDIFDKERQKTAGNIVLMKGGEGSLQSTGSFSPGKEGIDCTVIASSQDNCKTTKEHCHLPQREGNGESLIKSGAEMSMSEKIETDRGLLSSQVMIGQKDGSTKGEHMLGSESTSSGVPSNRPSGDTSSGTNVDEVKELLSTRKDACPLSAIQTERKSRSKLDEQRDSLQGSDRTLGVSKPHQSFEGNTTPKYDRHGQKTEKVLQDSGCLVQLFTETKDTNFIEVTDWPFPSTDQEKLRAAVFLHFWEQGYYLTSGMKFGGDFLVYKGSPLLFHSTYIAICIPYEKSMLAHTLVTYGRLGPIVKKTVILCSLNENDEVRCVSLQWSGI